jgi:hypothetical protein
MELLFTQGCHRRHISVILMTQNLFQKGSKSRTVTTRHLFSRNHPIPCQTRKIYSVVPPQFSTHFRRTPPNSAIATGISTHLHRVPSDTTFDPPPNSTQIHRSPPNSMLNQLRSPPNSTVCHVQSTTEFHPGPPVSTQLHVKPTGISTQLHRVLHDSKTLYKKNSWIFF